MYGRLSQLKQISIDGWDKYKDIKTDEDKKSWRIKQYYEWYIENKPKNLTVFEYHSVDLWLFIMCKAKQTVINEFIQFFGHGIKLFESYESKLLELLKTKQKSLNRELTEQEKIQIYNENKINETNLLLNSKNIISDIKNERTKQNKLQQFFTNDILAKFIYDFSSIKNNKNDLIKILEPTAGQGDLIKPILENNKNIEIALIEIDPENRSILKQLAMKSPTILHLQNQNNFLTFETSDRYDYIFMNPPFHLRKSEDFNLKRDTWDYDFIKKAFAFLKINGELLAITSDKWKQNEDFQKWIKHDNKKFEFVQKKNMKFSQIKIDVTCMKITKLNDFEDNHLLGETFYINQGYQGQLLNENEIDPDKIMDKKQNYNSQLKPFLNSDI